jgi:hypothetical protein
VASAFMIVFTLFAFPLHAIEKSEAITGAEAFAKLKSLAGNWNARIMTDDGPASEVSYRLSGGGSVVVETLFPRTSHEMITMYTLDGNDVVATHYCAAGNQPTMRLDRASSSTDQLVFSFVGVRGAHGDHVHDGRISFRADGTVEAVWNSTASSPKRFFLNRAK